MSAQPQVYRLLIAVRGGGAIVSAELCSPEELVLAKHEKRYARDADGFEYVWRPPVTRPRPRGVP